MTIKKGWVEIPQEDLWEDGELTFRQVALKIYDRVCCEGDWIIMRKLDKGEKNYYEERNPDGTLTD